MLFVPQFPAWALVRSGQDLLPFYPSEWLICSTMNSFVFFSVKMMACINKVPWVVVLLLQNWRRVRIKGRLRELQSVCGDEPWCTVGNASENEAENVVRDRWVWKVWQLPQETNESCSYCTVQQMLGSKTKELFRLCIFNLIFVQYI